MEGIGYGRAFERIAHLNEQLTEARALHNQAAMQRDKARAAIVECRTVLGELARGLVGDESDLAVGIRAAIMALKGAP